MKVGGKLRPPAKKPRAYQASSEASTRDLQLANPFCRVVAAWSQGGEVVLYESNIIIDVCFLFLFYHVDLLLFI